MVDSQFKKKSLILCIEKKRYNIIHTFTAFKVKSILFFPFHNLSNLLSIFILVSIKNIKTLIIIILYRE